LTQLASSSVPAVIITTSGITSASPAIGEAQTGQNRR
jgi:hypothetical protein